MGWVILNVIAGVNRTVVASCLLDGAMSQAERLLFTGWNLHNNTFWHCAFWHPGTL